MTDRNASERDYFWAALMFYTRLPVPKTAMHSQEVLNKSRKYFPLIGVIVGMISAITLLLSSMLFDPALSIALSMAISVLVTGAFHEDGFADSCDGLGGGWSVEQVLTIMKDSRIGTYGTLGLLFMIAIKFFALLEIAHSTNIWLVALALVGGHAISRQLASRMVDLHDYVQDIDASKIKPIADSQLSAEEKKLSWCFAIIPIFVLLFIAMSATLIAVLLSTLVSIVFMRYCQRRIGGYTGDILGSLQQLSELFFYLGLATVLP